MPSPPIDLQIVLSILYPGVNCGPMAGSLNTYSQLSAYWPAENGPCPTLAVLQAKWDEYLANPLPFMPVPQSVTRWRFMKALRATAYGGGTLYDAVNAAVSGSGSADLAAQWAEVTEILRASVVVASLSAALGLTSAQVDDVFRLAASYAS